MNKFTVFCMISVIAAVMTISASAQTLDRERNKEAMSDPAEEFKIYEIKHQNAAEIASLLPLEASVSPKFNAVMVSAVPHVHEIVASIIQKYDVPVRTVEFQFFLIKTITGETSPSSAELPEKVRIALNEAATRMPYKGFELIGAPLMLILEGSGADLRGQSSRGIQSYVLKIPKIEITEAMNKSQIWIDSLEASFQVPGEQRGAYQTVGISTSMVLTESTPVVVGTLQVLGDSVSNAAIVVIVTARIL